MSNRGNEIRIELVSRINQSPLGPSLVIRLSAGPDIVWDMLPNPTMPRSVIGPQAFADLVERGSIDAGNRSQIVVRDCRIFGHPVADLSVRVTAVVDRLFESVLWRPHAGDLVLRFP